MATVSIGGFSTFPSSFEEMGSSTKWVAIFFMLFSALNFSLHYKFFTKKEFLYFSSEESRFLLAWIFLLCIVSYFALFNNDISITDIIFNIISVSTTTGFASADYESWGGAMMLLLISGMFVGASTGSTGGGVKVVRVLILFKQAINSIEQLIHPHAILGIKYNKEPVKDKTMNSIWGFFSIFGITLFLGTLILTFCGNSFETSWSAAIACLTNTGPGFGSVGPNLNYAHIGSVSKVSLIFIMILGRLEILTLFVLLSRSFWKK